jgi:hypothetical protein
MRDSSSGDKLKIALFGDLSLEEAMDLSRDRLILELERFRMTRYYVSGETNNVLTREIVPSESKRRISHF